LSGKAQLPNSAPTGRRGLLLRTQIQGPLKNDYAEIAAPMKMNIRTWHQTIARNKASQGSN
jgi:hypothetical protein